MVARIDLHRDSLAAAAVAQVGFVHAGRLVTPLCRAARRVSLHRVSCPTTGLLCLGRQPAAQTRPN